MSNNHHGQTLKLSMKEAGISAKELADFIDRNQKYIYALWNKAQFTKIEIIIICHSLDLSYKRFGKTNPEMQSGLRKIGDHSANTRFIEYNDSNTSRLDEYFELLKEKVKQVEEKYYVYDYLVKKSNPAVFHNSAYALKVKEYLKEIEKLSKKSDVNYRRVLAPPIHYIKHDRILQEVIASDESLEDSDVAIIAVLKLMYPFFFNHLMKCFNLFQSDKFKIIVMSSARKQYSYAVMDDDSIGFETDKFNGMGFAEPDLLFTHTTSSGFYDPDIAQMNETYTRKFDNLYREGNNTDSPIWLVSQEQFRNKLYVFHNKVKLMIEDLERKKEYAFENSEFDKIDKVEKRLTPLKQCFNDLETKVEIYNDQFSG